MKLFHPCQACKRRAFLIKKRTYKHQVIGEITSQRELCGRCADDILKKIRGEVILSDADLPIDNP